LAPEKPSFLSENVKERMKLKIVSIAFSLEVKKLLISENIIVSLCRSILFGFCLATQSY
jgi:hypothetical protein